ncbi:hypothetical protein BO78DRAFT_108270 [Aspergillus sclerotiicarbonarius CBS 121057]|uniref:Uncharacterized protein n=1 Tax=Aspergillus sclerotiicarbonarius (strain CBS 121057 / IBT 28362) TaxID=1448318 RepID=A0A319EST4_ASPSB|nr:hypothetical protein BO78DRAFT_108270 [Aspergillus sclerotiicarbonarius CBS 121057]
MLRRFTIHAKEPIVQGCQSRTTLTGSSTSDRQDILSRTSRYYVQRVVSAAIPCIGDKSRPLPGRGESPAVTSLPCFGATTDLPAKPPPFIVAASEAWPPSPSRPITSLHPSHGRRSRIFFDIRSYGPPGILIFKNSIISRVGALPWERIFPPVAQRRHGIWIWYTGRSPPRPSGVSARIGRACGPVPGSFQ